MTIQVHERNSKGRSRCSYSTRWTFEWSILNFKVCSSFQVCSSVAISKFAIGNFHVLKIDDGEGNTCQKSSSRRTEIPDRCFIVKPNLPSIVKYYFRSLQHIISKIGQVPLTGTTFGFDRGWSHTSFLSKEASCRQYRLTRMTYFHIHDHSSTQMEIEGRDWST